MSDKNTLDDLILTDPEPEDSKSKGILILLGLVILLIIVGAILAKMIFSSPDDDIKKESSNEVKKEVNISKNNLNSNSSNKKESLSTPADADLAPLDDTSLPANIDTVSIDEKTNENSKQKDKNENDNSAMSITKPETNINNEPKKEVVKKERKPLPKPKHKVTKQKHKPKPKHLIGGSGSVYIQVGYFSKGPTKSFIDKIRKARFKYRIKEVNGFRRVLVGPFRSQEEANSYLDRVKAQISPSAFIKKKQ